MAKDNRDAHGDRLDELGEKIARVVADFFLGERRLVIRLDEGRIEISIEPAADRANRA